MNFGVCGGARTNPPRILSDDLVIFLNMIGKKKPKLVPRKIGYILGVLRHC